MSHRFFNYQKFHTKKASLLKKNPNFKINANHASSNNKIKLTVFASNSSEWHFCNSLEQLECQCNKNLRLLAI